MAFHLISSNKMEILADQLAGIIHQDPLHPLHTETIVVQSQGMARWLSMELADRLTIWANGSFPFPNRFLDEITELLFPEYRSQHLFVRDEAVWQLMHLFTKLPDTPVFSSVLNYIDTPFKSYQLACVLADLFDQYTVYRPDLLQDWEKGSDDDWQQYLWKELITCYGLKSRAAILCEIVDRLATETGDLPLPARVSVFGISLLPPLYLDVLNALSRHIEVYFFFLNPSRHWWADIRPEREILKLSREHQTSPEDLYLETGNSLLASMGGLGRNFLAMLQDYDIEEIECYTPPAEDKFLHVIQQDILELREEETEKICDDSLIVNSCHSPMREVEVLQDHLLSLFEKDESFKPRDIIVMVPDIETYSPFIQAVFGIEAEDLRYIPYTIADSSMVRHNELADAFLALIGLAGSRFSISQVKDILRRPPVQEKFKLSGDLGIIDEWCDGTAIRWGRDDKHRKELGLPGFSENTWRAGFDRLLLGYAMTGGELFADALPYDGFEEGDTEALTRLLDAFDTISGTIEQLEQSWDLRTWSAVLLDLLDSCMSVSQKQEQDMQYLRTVLYNLRIYQERSGCNDTLPLEVIKSYIAKELEREKSPYGYLSGGITFCSMLPMRAVPFPVVCLLGMEDGSFPRPDIAFSFDRMAREPRLGDRSRRDDDRYLFLEAFLSARKQFYISFVGQSVRDDSKLPPSVLVSELLEYVGKISRDQAHDNVMCDDLIKRHRLQPFNPEYFSSEHVFSYNTIHCQAAEMLQRGPDPDAGFWHDMPLPLSEEDFFQLDLNDFLLFVTHPVRFFCNRRLGLILSESKKSIEDDEPLKIEGLEKYILSEDVVDLLLAQKTKEMIRPILKSKGLLPHGRVGEVESDDLIDEVSLFVDRFKTMADVQHVPVDLHIQCGDYKVYGQLPGLREKGLFFARCAVVKGKDLLLGWISHLLLNCQAEQDRELPRETFIFGKDTQFKFKAVTSPYPLLQQILDLYRQGVQEPLPFFAETSYVFAKEMLKGDKVKAHKKAREKWQGGYNSRGECEDIYLSFRYAGQFPRDSEFEEYALAMYHPLFEYLEEEETA